MLGLDGSSIKRSSRCAAGLPGRSYLPYIPPGSALPRNGCAAIKNAMAYAIAFLIFRFLQFCGYKRPAGAQCTAAMPCSVLQALKRYGFFFVLQAIQVCICPRGELYANRRHGKSVLWQLRIAFACIAPLCWPFWSQHSSSTFFICLPFCSKRQAARNLQPQNGQGCIIEALP